MDTSPEATADRLRRVYACISNSDECNVYGVRKYSEAQWHREQDERALAREWIAEHQPPEESIVNDKATSQEPAVWACVELMGHVKLAGRLTEEEKFGAKLGRLDIPTEDGGFVTQFFGGGSIYRVTLVTEDVARHIAKRTQPEPVHSWDFPKQLAGRPVVSTGDTDPDDDRYDDDLPM